MTQQTDHVLEKKVTAVEYLEKICKDRGYYLMEEYFEQAKVIEKEQIEDAHIEGQRVFDKYPHTQWTNDQAEQYYKDTYEKGGETIKS